MYISYDVINDGVAVMYVSHIVLDDGVEVTYVSYISYTSSKYWFLVHVTFRMVDEIWRHVANDHSGVSHLFIS